MSARKKVTIAGAGNTGASMAQLLALKNIADIVLVDIIEGLPQGKALDLTEAGNISGHDVSITGTNDWADTAGSDVVVITSGVPRKPGMTREDLLATNARIVRGVAEQAFRNSPNAVFIVFANPMDVMCHVMLRTTGLDRARVIGQGGMLDSARYRAFIAMELGASVRDVQAWVLGGHTEATMVPLLSNAMVGGVPLTQLVPPERRQALVTRAKNGGKEIVDLLKTGSAFYAPAAATISMVEAVLLDQQRVLPCAVHLEGEYGVRGAYVGVMAVLGAGGVQKVIEQPLAPDELEEMRKAGAAVHELLQALDKAEATTAPGGGS